MDSNISDQFSCLVESLGGLSLQPGDVKNLADIDTGKLLLKWLADQVSHDDSANFVAKAGGQEQLNAPSSLLQIALEDDEVAILQHIESSKMEQFKSSQLSGTGNYPQPSRLSRHGQYFLEENDLVNQEAEIIRGRILQTQKMSKKLSQTIKSLQRALFGLETNVRMTEQRLSESSINVDTAIATNVNKAQKLLQELGYPSDKVEVTEADTTGSDIEDQENTAYCDLDGVRSILSSAQEKLSMITINLAEDLLNFSVLREQEDAKVGELEADLIFLQNTFETTPSPKEKPMKVGTGPPDEEAVTKQLAEICLLLEAEVSLRKGGVISSDGAIEALLSEIDKKPGKKLPEEERFSVKRMVTDAWTLDQAQVLWLQQEILDEASDRMSIGIAPLEELHRSLTSLIRVTQDVEALLEALGEELQEICPNSPVISDKNVSLHDDETFQRLKLLLTELKDLRPGTAALLALITKDDVLEELRIMKAHCGSLERAEKTWANEMIQQCLTRPLETRLNEIYKNSKMNDSPPFSFTSDVCELEQQTRMKTNELQKLADSLEVDVREFFVKDSQLKRFDAFIEKWS